MSFSNCLCQTLKNMKENLYMFPVKVDLCPETNQKCRLSVFRPDTHTVSDLAVSCLGFHYSYSCFIGCDNISGISRSLVYALSPPKFENIVYFLESGIYVVYDIFINWMRKTVNF